MEHSTCQATLDGGLHHLGYLADRVVGDRGRSGRRSIPPVDGPENAKRPAWAGRFAAKSLQKLTPTFADAWIVVSVALCTPSSSKTPPTPMKSMLMRVYLISPRI
jgi:hypothetical protein